jgi:hypothetical protein
MTWTVEGQNNGEFGHMHAENGTAVRRLEVGNWEILLELFVYLVAEESFTVSSTSTAIITVVERREYHTMASAIPLP